MQLQISQKEKITAFQTTILHKEYSNKETHADVCYLVVKLCNKVDKPSAIPFLKKELALRKKYVSSNKNLIARTYYNLGYFYWFQEDYNNVLTYHDSLLSFVKVKDKRSGKAYELMARVYKNTGDYQRALDYFDQAETIFKKVEAKRNLLGVYINKLTLFVEQKYRFTNSDFKALESEILNFADKAKATEKQRLMILFNLGTILYHSQQNKTSLSYYNKSLLIAEKIEDSLKIAQIYMNKALVYVKKSELDEALLLNEKALLFVGNAVDEKSTIYDNLGDIYVRQKQYEKGIKFYNKAVNELLPFHWETKENLPDYEKIIASSDRKFILGYLIDKQHAWLRFYETTKNKKDLLAAEQTLQLIDKVIDDIYFESKEKLSKLFWRKEGAKLYVNAVKICFLLNNPAKAFYYIEKSKGVTLLENISAFSAKRMAKLPQEVIEKEQMLSQSVKKMEQLFVSDKKKDSLKSHYFTAKEKYHKYVRGIEKEYPNYLRYRTSLPIIATEKVQESLAEYEVVIAYILGEEDGYVLLMNQKSLQIYPLKDLKSLKSSITAFQKLYTKPFETTAEATNFQQEGFKIYQQLLPFWESTMYQKATKLTVVSDGNIHTLPLELLPTSISKKLEETYLIQEKEVSYRYSFSLDRQNELNRSNGKPESTSFMLTKFKDTTLTSLSTTSENVFEGTTFLNENATKERFLKAYNETSQVYISSHAGTTNTIPWLAMFDEKVYPNELYFLNNPKELVVLNACKTSAGIFNEGEGVFSLTRAFLNSGSKSVVASLWNLNEKSGMEIFTTFRSNLAAGQTKSEALHHAKLMYLKKYANTSQSSPYYWSGMVLTGNTEALSTSVNIWKTIGFAIVGISIIFFYFKYRKRSY
ncbi:CHAT domain-containing tetratricopeptide repeat protein [Kordia algicida OT-1]|nr:CHAT domain-containing tetratricopeptide repeat protein [Kordia algicida]